MAQYRFSYGACYAAQALLMKHCYALQNMTVSVFWFCETCGESGEIEAEVPGESLDELRIEDAATATLEALRNVSHPHPVRAEKLQHGRRELRIGDQADCG